jgi:hypothetical protein
MLCKKQTNAHVVSAIPIRLRSLPDRSTTVLLLQLLMEHNDRIVSVIEEAKVAEATIHKNLRFPHLFLSVPPNAARQGDLKHERTIGARRRAALRDGAAAKCKRV